MWQSLSKQLSEVLMFDFKIVEKTQLDGGDISKCYMISDGEQRYFVKVNERDFFPRFELEAEGIKKLSESNSVLVPEVIHIGYCKDQAFIILNFLAAKPLESAKASYKFGLQLAKLHQSDEQGEYGYDHDNYVGSTLQPNKWNKSWARFFSEQRIGWQLQLLKEKGISFGAEQTIVDFVYKELKNHNPTPSLLHGDLWHGNVSNTAFGPICYDPACYWGDPECDIAMTELFGGFMPDFYVAYESVRPLGLEYQSRKHIYNLYHVLNHCNLFGGPYLDQAQEMIESMMKAYTE
ncbi:fructosamine kinase family protein [Vibrio tapetis subsp. quintayensis]|uniref:fructosamine kinase family protein n=1 Tax=Vibrio tapetis TaxID=52443 RepID=UPI0025B4FABA|nr:fructosamine kinase family protein [Vibrio tapetis]MDN3679133.1 fructosamine kinase family protein [Vibrio tapetis subsp. quintayensis]